MEHEPRGRVSGDGEPRSIRLCCAARSIIHWAMGWARTVAHSRGRSSARRAVGQPRERCGPLSGGGRGRANKFWKMKLRAPDLPADPVYRTQDHGVDDCGVSGRRVEGKHESGDDMQKRTRFLDGLQLDCSQDSCVG